MLKELANLIRKDAISCIEDSIDYPTNDDMSAEMKSMYNEDGRDLLKVAELIEQNKIQEAYEYARHMDTAARERINDRVWDFMFENIK